jgi:hypothetical protein
MKPSKLSVFFAFLAGVALPLPEAFAAAGQFQFVAGEVRLVQSDGRAVAAQKGLEVNEGDTVVTGKSGSAQLRMVDEGVVALRPDSALKVENYRFQGKEDGSERGIFALIKGGFRTLTGIIGRANKGAYLVRTPAATIGVRGTDHEPLFVPPEGWSGAPDAVPGTYDKVNAGEVFMETEGGRIELFPNQVGFAAADPRAMPVRLPAIPGFMRATPPPQGKAEGRAVRETASQDSRRDLADGRRGEDRRALAQMLRDEKALRQLQTADGDVDLGQGAANLHAAPEGTAIVAGDLSKADFLGSGAGIVKPNGLQVLLDQAGHPALIREIGGDFQYLRSGAALVDGGEAAVTDGAMTVQVRWGIYSGGVIVDASGTRAVKYFHFAGANETPVSLPANMAYAVVVGATKPIADTGAVGGAVSSVDIRINGASELSRYDLSLTDALGRSWTTHLKGAPISLTQFASGVGGALLSGSCSGGTCGTLPLESAGMDASYAKGVPVGPTGQGLLSSYTLRTVGGGHGVTGSLVARPKP